MTCISYLIYEMGVLFPYTRCKTIVNGPPLPQPETSIPDGDGDVDEWRHLLAMRLQVRRPSGYRVKRKHGAVRLRRLCERITRAKVH